MADVDPPIDPDTKVNPSKASGVLGLGVAFAFVASIPVVYVATEGTMRKNMVPGVAAILAFVMVLVMHVLYLPLYMKAVESYGAEDHQSVELGLVLLFGLCVLFGVWIVSLIPNIELPILPIAIMELPVIWITLYLMLGAWII
jgi:hypothetical protein